jgi:hypothetical protein
MDRRPLVSPIKQLNRFKKSHPVFAAANKFPSPTVSGAARYSPPARITVTAQDNTLVEIACSFLFFHHHDIMHHIIHGFTK